MFRLQAVRRSFGAKQVLRGVTLDVPAGQFVAIIGKSGCGKSTLLRLLAGLDTPDGGRVERQGATRIMFQEPRLLPWERVAENVAVGPVTADQARTYLAEVGLSDHAGDWPATLSGGQKQRVALARALAGRPAILALDEPLGALDALTRIEMQRLLERIWREKGFTAVLVTHDVAEAVILADRVILLEEGEVALDLTIDLPRPRRHGAPEVAAIEAQILDRLLTPAQ
ncbi:ATP-binding cassette domain-containing protein [Paenirhodobacter sp.]|uniref:ATP-binding cassette domain-containing protein n=1 Tax=Paenirhodobacter sp. TaxID=1965326 RepID=UPI003B3C3EE5